MCKIYWDEEGEALVVFKVLVLVATYNGGKFIKEQLESVINQKDVDVSILILDDKSSDDTVEIIDAFSKKYLNVRYSVNEKNLGYKKNFRKLIEMSLQYDYDFAALCDQDDVWLENKLINGIKFIRKTFADFSHPILYSSNLTVVTESLEHIGYMYREKDISKFKNYNLLLENKCTGCTSIFNKELAELVSKIPYELMKIPHDTILERIAILYGNYVFDKNSYILYRQHGDNQIGALNKGGFRKYFDFILNKKTSFQSENLYDICKILGFNNKYQNFVFPIIKYKKNLAYKIKILFGSKYKKISFLKTIVFKISILLNKY